MLVAPEWEIRQVASFIAQHIEDSVKPDQLSARK
jgi:hypothetical protein